MTWEQELNRDLIALAKRWGEQDCILDCERCPLNKKVRLIIDDANVDFRVSKCKMIDSLNAEAEKVRLKKGDR